MSEPVDWDEWAAATRLAQPTRRQRGRGPQPNTLTDPALYGVKVIVMGHQVLVKCKARCYPGKGDRVPTMAAAHAWALQHRRDYPRHDALWTEKQAAR